MGTDDLFPAFSAQRRSDNWTTLAEKLKALVKMRGHWGDLHSIYETRAESMFEQQPLPPWIRDPESEFSRVWDITSAVLLLFVCFATPVRACFGVAIELWSFAFWLDLLIDTFFMIDVAINARTAFSDPNGFRENRPRKIFVAYLKGWFLIDMLSCLPVGYIQYFQTNGCIEGRLPDGSMCEETTDNARSLKSLRLMKLTKMLRLGRLKRIIQERSDDENMVALAAAAAAAAATFFRWGPR